MTDSVTAKREDVNQEQIGPFVGALICTIIEAATITACTAAATVVSRIPTGEKPEITGAFVNRTKWSWEPVPATSAPLHGHWGKAAGTVASCWPAVKSKAISEKISYEDSAAQFNSNEENEEGVEEIFYLVGDGMGGESLSSFQIPVRSAPPSKLEINEYNDWSDFPADLTGSNSIHIVLYLKKLSGGHHYGGVAIGEFLALDHGKGDPLAKIMRDNEDKTYSFTGGSWKCVFSYQTRQSIDYTYTFTNAADKKEEGTITVAFTPGTEINFEVSFKSPTLAIEPKPT